MSRTVWCKHDGARSPVGLFLQAVDRNLDKNVNGSEMVIWDKSLLLLAALMLCAIVSADAQPEPTGSSSRDYMEAESLVRAHQWDQGLHLLQSVLQRDPRDVKALNLAGLASTGMGKIRQADEYFQKAIEVNPTFVPSLKNLGVNEFSLHDVASAEKHLTAAVKLQPQDQVINLYLGEIAYSRRDFGKAAERLRKADNFLSRDKNLQAHLAVSQLQSGQTAAGVVSADNLPPDSLSTSAQFELGLTLAQADLPDRAIPYFVALRRRYPDSYNTAYNLVICYIGAKKYSEAISLANQWVSDGHDTDEFENAMAEAYERSQDTPHAIAALRRAIELNPDADDNYLDFANMCIDHRDFDNGLKVIGVGLQVHPNSYRLVFERGVLYAMEDRFDLAEQDFQLSAKLAPASDFGVVGMGVTYLETGNAAKAIDLLHQRLKQNPNDASLLYLLGEALMRNGATAEQPQYAEAQSAFEKSVRLNPNLCLPHVALGEIYLDEERFKDAVSQLESARAIDPREKSAYSHLAVAYRHLGDVESAKRILGQLKDLYQQEQGWMHNKMKPATESSPESSQTGPS